MQETMGLKENDIIFPKRLLNIKRPPKEIFYKGDISLIDNAKNMAVIGSRHVSDEKARLSFETGYKLAKMGINVVNGLAIGCDTYALKGALFAGGKCIAVLPCGLDKTVPKSNSRLAKEILDLGGCLISEYPIGTAIEKYRYIERDRLQSAISDGVIVVEAGPESGTMHTVKAAIGQGKKIACFEGSQMADDRRFFIVNKVDTLEGFVEHTFNSVKYFQMSIEDLRHAENSTPKIVEKCISKKMIL